MRGLRALHGGWIKTPTSWLLPPDPGLGASLKLRLPPTKGWSGVRSHGVHILLLAGRAPPEVSSGQHAGVGALTPWVPPIEWM